jgi:hypothetical protein
VLISIDEKTGSQAKPRIRPDIPGRPGRDARREFEYKRHGTVSMKATGAWITAHPRFSVTYTPKHASWLNMTGQWSGVLTRKLLRRGDFTSREHLEAQITGFTIRHNETAHPYKRSYDADAGHARYLERGRSRSPRRGLRRAARPGSRVLRCRPRQRPG